MKRYGLIGLMALAALSNAQVVMTGSTYYQDFDTLANTGTGNVWTDNATTAQLVGWYATTTSYDADSGTATFNGFFSEGNGTSTERALGSLSLLGGVNWFGARLQNGSTSTFGSLYVDYTGEQWRAGGVGLFDVLAFEYSTNATSLLSGSWTAVTSLDFNSPISNGSGALNGNLPANQQFLASTITGLSWAAGTDLWIRWRHQGNASRDIMAIDEVHLAATPVSEPTTLTALALAASGILARRRRR